ncbi:DUF6119 family protein [Actinomadura keratinilytica]
MAADQDRPASARFRGRGSSRGGRNSDPCQRAASSAPLSHLFAQGRVSAEALRFDAEARAEFVHRVRERRPGHPVGEEFTPRRVVYAISLKSGKALTTTNLFTFAQVSLLQATRALRAQGIDVSVVGIPSVDSSA